MWDLVVAKGAWITVDNSLIEELKTVGIDMPKQHQGRENFRKWLEENADATKHLFNKLKAVQSK
jgi:post-segregation antitoxin (ccd killing protein)